MKKFGLSRTIASLYEELDALDDLHIYRSEPRRVYERTESIYARALQTNDEGLISRCAVNLGHCCLDQANYQLARQSLSKAANYYNATHQFQSASSTQRYLGVLENLLQNHSASEHHFNLAVELSRRAKNTVQESHALLSLCDLVMQTQGPAKALAVCERTIDAAGNDETRVLRFAYYQLYEIGRQLNREDLIYCADANLQRLLEADKTLVNVTLWDLGLAANQAFAQAQYYIADLRFTESQRLFEANHIPVTLSELLANHGMLLIMMGDNDGGSAKIRKGLQIAKKSRSERSIQYVLLKYAQAYRAIEAFDHCLRIIQHLEYRLRKFPNITLQDKVYELQFECYENLHRYKEAVHVSKILMAERKRFFGAGSYHTNYVAPLIDGYRKKVVQLQHSLIEENYQLNTFVKRILNVDKLTPPQRVDIKELIKEVGIKSQNINMELNDAFKKEIFAKVSKLYEYYPELSKTEIKICELLLATYSTTQIALALSLSDRTVDAHRRNIRKKLFIKPKEDLTRRLRELSEGKLRVDLKK